MMLLAVELFPCTIWSGACSFFTTGPSGACILLTTTCCLHFFYVGLSIDLCQIISHFQSSFRSSPEDTPSIRFHTTASNEWSGEEYSLGTSIHPSFSSRGTVGCLDFVQICFFFLLLFLPQSLQHFHYSLSNTSLTHLLVLGLCCHL